MAPTEHKNMWAVLDDKLIINLISTKIEFKLGCKRMFPMLAYEKGGHSILIELKFIINTWLKTAHVSLRLVGADP